MCIIAMHPWDAKKNITLDTLQTCFNRNGDGAGIAYYDKEKNEWVVNKGFMTWKEFKKAFKKLKFKKEDTWIAHFRIGTSGLKDAGNTHPFPAVDSYEKMRKTSFRTKKLVFHNGVIGQGDGDYSDTMVAVSKKIEPMVKHIWKNDKMNTILQDILAIERNRWLICSGPNMQMYGRWVKDADGNCYSNEGYKPVRVVHAAPTRGTTRTTTDDTPATSGAGNVTYNKQDGIEGTKPTVIISAKFLDDDGRVMWDKVRKQYFKPGAIQIETLDDIDRKLKFNITEEDLTLAIVDHKGQISFERQETEEAIDTFTVCPTCYEEKEIGASPFLGGECVCLRCGAVFNAATGEVVMYDATVLDGGLEKDGDDK